MFLHQPIIHFKIINLNIVTFIIVILIKFHYQIRQFNHHILNSLIIFQLIIQEESYNNNYKIKIVRNF